MRERLYTGARYVVLDPTPTYQALLDWLPQHTCCTMPTGAYLVLGVIFRGYDRRGHPTGHPRTVHVVFLRVPDKVEVVTKMECADALGSLLYELKACPRDKDLLVNVRPQITSVERGSSDEPASGRPYQSS